MDYSEGSGVQYHLGIKKSSKEQPAIGKYVIMPGDPKRCAKIAAYLEKPELVADNREYVTYTGYLEHVQVGVTSTGIGGPSASIAIEELVKSGADTFIRIGTCGGMDLQVQGGDLIIATGAIRAEGTTREYAPIEFPAVANLQVVNALVRAAEQLGYPFHTGIVHSKDSFYGEANPEAQAVGYQLMNQWDAWLKCGCLASEMESAALFVAGSCLKVKVGAVLLAVGNEERRMHQLEEKRVFDTEAAIETAVQAIRNLIIHRVEHSY